MTTREAAIATPKSDNLIHHPHHRNPTTRYIIVDFCTDLSIVFYQGDKAENELPAYDTPVSKVSDMWYGLKKVKFFHTRYRALGPELIPVYR